jgi:hypothetical protein
MDEKELSNIFISQLKAIKYRLPRQHVIELLSRLQRILAAIQSYLGKGETDGV